jgi:hypothetical protein
MIRDELLIDRAVIWYEALFVYWNVHVIMRKKKTAQITD